MNVLISGGCKNGKSYYAQKRAKTQSVKFGKPLYYIATMIPRDEEDMARIRKHIAERSGWGFKTLEQPYDLMCLLDDPEVDKSGIFLLDSVTALLDNEMFRRAIYEGKKGKPGNESVRDCSRPDISDRKCELKSAEENYINKSRSAGEHADNEFISETVKRNIEILPDETAPERLKKEVIDFAMSTGNTIFVSDYIYGDAEKYSRSTEIYRRALAAADRALASVCDRVIEISYGRAEIWK